MSQFIILLRGVMPTGKNKVPMAQLRDVLSRAEFSDVRTYIQSGNVLLKSDRPENEIAAEVRKLIKTKIGPDLPVIVRTPEQIKKVLKDNPFDGNGWDLKRVFFVLFEDRPDPKSSRSLAAIDYGDEKLTITKAAAYLYIPGPYGKGKLSAAFLEKKLGVAATMRNFNTLTKLIELSED